MAWKIALAALIGLLIGAALGTLIVRLTVRRRTRRAAERRHASILQSLDILCRALLQGQVDSSEASIRMSVLLDCLPADIQPKVDVAAIHQLASDCDVFDRGDARRALKPADRNRQDLQRLRLEDEQADAVHAATQRLNGVLQQWRQHLHP